MEHIIQQILDDFIRNFFKRVENGEICDIDIMAESLLDDCKGLCCDLLSATLKQMNLEIREDKQLRRDSGLYMIKHDQTRQLLTTVGLVEYCRDYYFDKSVGEYTYPLDDMISVAKYHRIGDSVCAAMINEAAKYSYQHASDIVTDGKVSRQTVKNQIHRVGNLEKPAPTEKSTAKELHIFADEDHIHLNTGKSRMVPYVVVTEGIDQEEKRHKTINPVHFGSRDLNGKTLWEKVAGYVHMAYGDDCIVYIHGDGARWIKAASEFFPDCEMVLDEFHLEKYLMRLEHLCPGINIRYRVRNAIENDDIKRMKGIIEQSIADIPYRQAKKVLKIETYLKDNWEEIQNNNKESNPGSCTEGQISHGIAERMSRNPMGWSEEGAGEMVMLRTYINNGLKAEAKDFRRDDDEKKISCLNDYAEDIYRDAVRGAKDWSLFEKPTYTMDLGSGTQNLINILGSTRPLAS